MAISVLVPSRYSIRTKLCFQQENIHFLVGVHPLLTRSLTESVKFLDSNLGQPGFKYNYFSEECTA